MFREWSIYFHSLCDYICKLVYLHERLPCVRETNPYSTLSSLRRCSSSIHALPMHFAPHEMHAFRRGPMISIDLRQMNCRKSTPQERRSACARAAKTSMLFYRKLFSSLFIFDTGPSHTLAHAVADIAAVAALEAVGRNVDIAFVLAQRSQDLSTALQKSLMLFFEGRKIDAWMVS